MRINYLQKPMVMSDPKVTEIRVWGVRYNPGTTLGRIITGRVLRTCVPLQIPMCCVADKEYGAEYNQCASSAFKG